ncbi:hypothetical protein RP20_CCG019114 [Aedes albopictus]|nr:hypothetical protein RP20_CCG019114 [Aedes albopictus]
MKMLVDYHRNYPEECLFGGNRDHSYSYYYYRNHPSSYRQLAATFGSGLKSRINSFLTLLMRRRQLQYRHRSNTESGGAEPSRRGSPRATTTTTQPPACETDRISFKSYCKRPKANG